MIDTLLKVLVFTGAAITVVVVSIPLVYLLAIAVSLGVNRGRIWAKRSTHLKKRN